VNLLLFHDSWNFQLPRQPSDGKSFWIIKLGPCGRFLGEFS
jgi:hypothetical protein